MLFSDAVQIQDKPRLTKDGYLVASARVARTGIQIYDGEQFGRSGTVRVYRPESEVFDKATLATFAHRPMTNDHPDDFVTADNWREHAIGYSGDEVARDGEYVRVPLIMTDAAAIADWQAGKRQLSMGYTAEIVFEPGTTPDGEQYDAVQKTIRNNHVALVDAARAGPEARIGDWGAPRKKLAPSTINHEDATMQKIVVDGLTIETTEQGAQVIERLQTQIRTMTDTASKTLADHEATVAARDAEIAKRDAEIEALKAQVLSPEQMDAAIADRVDLIGRAKAIADLDYSGKSPSQIKTMAVRAVSGEAAVKDRSDAYIDARFDALVEAEPRQQQSGAPAPIKDGGYQAYIDRISNAWKQEA